MVGGAILVWFLGAVVGWFVGWVARGDFNRAWYRGTAARLAATQAQLAEALGELEEAHAWWEAQRGSPPVAPVVHVHVAAPLPWAAHHPAPLHGTHIVDAITGPPVREVRS